MFEQGLGLEPAMAGGAAFLALLIVWIIVLMAFATMQDLTKLSVLKEDNLPEGVKAEDALVKHLQGAQWADVMSHYFGATDLYDVSEAADTDKIADQTSATLRNMPMGAGVLGGLAAAVGAYMYGSAPALAPASGKT